MTRLDITRATRLRYRRLDFRMVQRRQGEIDWTCDRTNESETFTDVELVEMIADGRAELLGMGGSYQPDPEPDPDPEDVPAAEMKAALRRLEYVEDVRKANLGKRPSAAAYRATNVATAERLGDPPPLAENFSRNVKRWDARAGDPANAFKLIADHASKGNRTDRITDDQRDIIDRMIDKYHLRQERPSVDSLVAMVRDEVNVVNETHPEDPRIAIPGRRAIETVLRDRDPEEVDAARYGHAYAEQKHGFVDRQPDPVAPLDRVEVDHTRADVFVVSEEDHLPIGRPTIGFAIDRCTRMPLGLYIGFEEPSVLSFMQILKHAMFPKTYVSDKIETGEWDLGHRWEAWGTPRTIVLDRAKENLGRDLRPSARALGIREVVFAASRRGRQKGAVERHFRTLNRRLLHEQKGTTFSSIGERKDYDPAKNVNRR